MSSAPSNGGMPARRAVVRWASRGFRRDWRQHLLILSLLTVAIAAAVGFSCAAFNVAPVPGQSEFGDANHWFRFNDPDPATLQPKLDAATAWFGEIDAIGHRPVPLPGTVKQIDYRSQQPDGPFGKPLLRLRSGRYPVADDEVAVTNSVAEDVGTRIGSTIDLDGVSRNVVGIVENPSKLGDDFVLLPPSALAQSKYVTMLVDASEGRVNDFRPPGDTGRILSGRGDLPEDVLAAVLILVVSTLVLALVALIATSSFMVIAQRRLPQLGMMSAIGATEKHLRLTMLATGAVTGVVAAVIGTAVGLAGWIAVAPSVSNAVGHRLDAFNIPWWLLIAAALLAVTAATAAAWWPGRTMARMPTVLALSGRPPDRPALHRSSILAIVCLVGGAACLAVGSKTGSASAIDLVLISAGMLGVVAGVLLVSPVAIQALARLATRVPVAPRLALRDLSRYRSRSGAALAAIALALGIAVSIVATAAAAENNAGAGNLSPTQLLVHARPTKPTRVCRTRRRSLSIRPASTRSRRRCPTRRSRGSTSRSTRRRQPAQPAGGVPRFVIARPVDGGLAFDGLVYVASPGLLSAYGLDSSALAGKDIVTSEPGALEIIGRGPSCPEPANAGGAADLSGRSAPHLLLAAQRAAQP